MNNYYTYAYLREDGTPYYIGKGSGNRAYKNDGRPCGKPVNERILILKNNISEEEAFRHEIYMISLFGRKDLRTGVLHNRTDGGDGSSGAIRSNDVKKRISDSMKGKPKSKEHIEKVSKSLKGREHTEDTKRKISKSNKGRILTEKTRENMKNSMKKRWESGLFKGTTGLKVKREKPTHTKYFILTDPNGVVYNVKDGLKTFCFSHSISYQTMYYGLHYKNGNATNGWKINYDDSHICR